MPSRAPLRIGLDPALAAWSAEIKYVFRTLLRVGGYPYEFVFASESAPALDIYYGLQPDRASASVTIRASGLDFSSAPTLEPLRRHRDAGVSYLDFGEGPCGLRRIGSGRLCFASDIVFASYWLLTGARERTYRRDRWDNLHLDGSFLLASGLLSDPVVSVYGALLRAHFTGLGRPAAALPWTPWPAEAAFVFTHDVDYPQIIGWIECLRLLSRRGLAALPSVAGILDGSNHFWKFSEWLEFEKKLGARPAFYFMARKGSLAQYALGTPDGFYDVRAPEFRELFRMLLDEGCEIGLHASYRSYRSVQQLRAEKELLASAAGAVVEGVRHHYWHLDPDSPNETLARHERAGLVYDSSLAYEFYPGFRRGICHPFRPFHPGERRELDLVELPPTWMDDHFAGRLARNHIADPVAHARGLLDAVRSTGGTAIVNYHPRGMNADFYPRFGPWLTAFVQEHLGPHMGFCLPGEVVRRYRDYERALESSSRDLLTTHHLEVSSSRGDEQAAGVTVRRLAPDGHGSWDAFVGAHPQGTIYHTLAWKAVTEEGFGHEPHYLHARDGNGTTLGVLPLFLVRGIFGRRLVSLPLRDRGSVLSVDPRVTSALVGRALELGHELDCDHVELRSLEPLDPETVAMHALQCRRDWITTRIDLAPGVRALWSALDKDFVRWAVKKAERDGLEIAIDDGESAIDTFAELFVRTRSSMGIPPFPRQLFEAIRRHLIARGMANLFLIRIGAEPIHGMINLFSHETFIPAYAAPQREMRKRHPNELMIWRTIEWAAQNGFRSYDFGADSSRQSGLLAFKRKWGGVHHRTFSYVAALRAGAGPDLDSSSSRYRLARRVWSLLPIPVSGALGGWVTRQLG